MTAKRDRLLIALIACSVAMLVHHAHNAQFIADYPRMPGWLSPEFVYLAWLGATAVGVGGYLLLRVGARITGACALLCVCSVRCGHPTMNGTILLEAATGVVLVVAVLRRMV